MKASVSPRLEKSPLLCKINAFLATPQYTLLVCALCLLSNFFGLELPVYGIYTLITVYVCFYADDLLPLVPVLLVCYISPSVGNNPGRIENSVFSGLGGILIASYGTLIGLSCLYRMIRDRQQYLQKKYRLLPGMLILWLGYLLGGIGSDGYLQKAPQHLFFAFLQGASVCVLYVLFSGGIRWENTRRDYFAWVGFCMGGVLFLQILGIYLRPETVVAGVIHRENIYTGWGIHNNLGGMLAMMIPFAFYLATKYRKGWLGTVAGSLYLLGVLLSCSRNAILTGTASYFAGIVLVLYYARNRKGNTLAALCCIGVSAAAVILFNGKLLRLFSDILSMGFDPNSRDSIYAKGMELFYRYPILGGSFFPPPDLAPWGWSLTEAFTEFFPARWHNTFVQLLASCGLLGLAAYLPHRFQTLLLIVKDHTKEKIFIGCSILVLLCCSLFDCHFFNIGPTLFYSTALAFAENTVKPS